MQDDEKRTIGKWWIPFLCAAVIAAMVTGCEFISSALHHVSIQDAVDEYIVSGDWIQPCVLGAVGGFLGGWVLLFFKWIENGYEAARRRKEIENEEATREGNAVTAPSSRLAFSMFVVACVTFWMPVVGIAITGYAVFLAGRDDLPGFVGCLEVCLLLASIGTTLAAIIVIGTDLLCV